MRWIALVTAAALAVAAAPAEGAKRKRTKRHALAVTSIVIPVGRAALDPQRTLTLRGRIANRGRRTKRVVLTFAARTTRSRRGNAYALGARNVLVVRGRSAKRFRVTVLPSANLPTGRRLYVTACVRRRVRARARCRTSRRTIVFAPRRREGPPRDLPSTQIPPAEQPAPNPPSDTTPAPPTHTPGARTAGDRLFPQIGNGGYDAQHYDLDLQYEPIMDLILATATIEAKATQNLSEFSFDLQTMDAGTVEVDGADANFTQEGNKLIVTPPKPIDAGQTFTTTVGYGGIATPFQDPDESYEGFLPTSDGAYVVNEPVGAMTWFPNNNVPTDKALYDITVTVPPGSTVFGNGRS
jgi:hypothetical protein